MNMDDSRMIARLQSLTTGFMAAKRLGQWRPELADELYGMWLELEQRGLKNTPECRNTMSRAAQNAQWLAGLAKLSSPDAALPLSSKQIERIATPSDASQNVA
jgi:hypothetical protein